MNADRIKEIQQETAFPESLSVCQALLKVWNETEQEQLRIAAVMPRLFFVVEETEDGVWEQITIGLSTYEEAKAYKDRWDGKHPNAFIVASLNEA